MAFRINRVYTRSGDLGETGLVGGSRVSKTNPRVTAYGELDELNSVLGVVKEEATRIANSGQSLGGLLEFLQQELFDLGAQLATPADGRYSGMWEVTEAHVERLETLCDAYGYELPELVSFILPGGSRVAALLHVARCVARRAERAVITLSQNEPNSVPEPVLAYVNRLSDLLFILARWALLVEGKTSPLWVQERSRTLPAEVVEILDRAAVASGTGEV